MTDDQIHCTPPVRDGRLLTFFVEDDPDHVMMSSGAGMWLAEHPARAPHLAEYMRRCADAIEAGHWTADPSRIGQTVESAVPIPVPAP